VIFIKNKYIILVVLVILIIAGAGIIVSYYNSQNNQQNDTTTINNNNTNEDMSSNITNNNTNNNINSKSTVKYQKPKPQQTNEPILISEKQAINIVKGFLESDESSDVVSNHAKLIKVGKKHYWVVKKYDYELYIDAKTGDSVNPKLGL
jgi:cytoskeletal protein RodZ